MGAGGSLLHLRSGCRCCWTAVLAAAAGAEVGDHPVLCNICHTADTVAWLITMVLLLLLLLMSGMVNWLAAVLLVLRASPASVALHPVMSSINFGTLKQKGPPHLAALCGVVGLACVLHHLERACPEKGRPGLF